MSKLEHGGLWICSHIMMCMEAGAVSVVMPGHTLPWRSLGMHWLEVPWLGSGDMPRERCCVRARVASREGESEAAIHSFVPGLHWWLQPVCKGAPDTGLKDSELTVQKQLSHFMVTEAPGGTQTKSPGASGLFHAAMSTPATDQRSTEPPALLALARACFGPSFPDQLL